MIKSTVFKAHHRHTQTFFKAHHRHTQKYILVSCSFMKHIIDTLIFFEAQHRHIQFFLKHSIDSGVATAHHLTTAKCCICLIGTYFC